MGRYPPRRSRSARDRMKHLLLGLTLPMQAIGSLCAFLRFGFDVGYRRALKWLLKIMQGG